MYKLPLLKIDGYRSSLHFLVQIKRGSVTYSLSLICSFILKIFTGHLTRARYHDKLKAYEANRMLAVMTTVKFSKCYMKVSELNRGV